MSNEEFKEIPEFKPLYDYRNDKSWKGPGKEVMRDENVGCPAQLVVDLSAAKYFEGPV